MARKTKKKKIISDYRRKLKLLENQTKRTNVFTVDDQHESVEKIPFLRRADRVETKKASPVVSYTSIDKREMDKQTKLIANDLKKTVVLSVIGVGFLVALYFSKSF